MLDMVRKFLPVSIAQEITSVQPMPSDLFSKVYEQSKSEEQLIAEGYTPIDPATKLMWTKSNKD